MSEDSKFSGVGRIGYGLDVGESSSFSVGVKLYLI